MQCSIRIGISALLAVAIGPSASAHTLQQRVGIYEGSDGRDRQRLALDADLTFQHQGQVLSGSSYAVTATRDFYQNKVATSDDSKYERELYESDLRVNDALSTTVSQTWNRITDSRLIAAFSKDETVSSRTGGGGVGHWFLHETLQIGLDVSRTFVEKPSQKILDVDAEDIVLPRNVDSTGTTLAVKHLSTPTTITQIAYTQVQATDRPPTHTVALGVRQFVTPFDGAIHLNASRMVNRGAIGTNTRKGQVSAWQGETAWLQNLWQGALARVGYRAYVEDETTRATESEKVYGSDTVSVNLAQDLPKGTLAGQPKALTVSAGAARYLNNDQLSASTFEMGLLARF